jgi:hypothetical protein
LACAADVDVQNPFASSRHEEAINSVALLIKQVTDRHSFSQIAIPTASIAIVQRRL